MEPLTGKLMQLKYSKALLLSHSLHVAIALVTALAFFSIETYGQNCASGQQSNTYSFDFSSYNIQCVTPATNNAGGSWWDVGGGPCSTWTGNIPLTTTASCNTGNGISITIRYNASGTGSQPMGTSDSLIIGMFCITPNPNYDTIYVIRDTILGYHPPNAQFVIYYMPCEDPDSINVFFKVKTTASNKKFLIGQQDGWSCVNCGQFIFLPITIHNERLHHQEGQLHYTFDLEDTDLEVAAITLGRSTDGATFHPVTFTDPHPTGSQYTRYNLVDKQPEFPAYYRVELLTHDGEYKYGQVLIAENGQAPNPILHPNPVSRGGKLVLEYAGNFSQGILSDIHGRTSYTFPLKANESGRASITIPSHLPVGIYLLRLNNQFQAAHYRVVVSD